MTKSHRFAPVRHLPITAVLCAALVVVIVVLATAYSSGSTDVPGGKNISSGSSHVNLVAYATPKPGFDAIIPAFRDTPEGRDIGFSASYGASGDQSRKVARHVPADVVNMSVEPDITRLVKAHVVDKDWKKQSPTGTGVPFGSVVVLVVRKGNPKNIHTWNDLLKPGVEVITPNPASSGSAQWNMLAPYAAESHGGRDPQAGLAFVKKLVSEHIRVSPSSGRQATTTFEQGQGDVLISYENEAIMLARKNVHASTSPQIDYIVPAQTFKIENPVAVVNTSSDKQAATTFVNWLYTPAAQTIWAQQGFRPVEPAVAQQTAYLFTGHGEIAKLWTIKDLGGWDVVSKKLFGTKGSISKIFSGGAT